MQSGDEFEGSKGKGKIPHQGLEASFRRLEVGSSCCWYYKANQKY